jgi:zinc/manganese transport system substrate-binding protein
VFIESMTSDRMARMLAAETGAVLGGTVYSDALSPPSGPAPTYLDMLRHNTTLFAKAMQGSSAR